MKRVLYRVTARKLCSWQEQGAGSADDGREAMTEEPSDSDGNVGSGDGVNGEWQQKEPWSVNDDLERTRDLLDSCNYPST